MPTSRLPAVWLHVAFGPKCCPWAVLQRPTDLGMLALEEVMPLVGCLLCWLRVAFGPKCCPWAVSQCPTNLGMLALEEVMPTSRLPALLAACCL